MPISLKESVVAHLRSLSPEELARREKLFVQAKALLMALTMRIIHRHAIGQEVTEQLERLTVQAGKRYDRRGKLLYGV